MAEDYAAWASRWRVSLGFILAAAYLLLAQPSRLLLLCGGAIAVPPASFCEAGRQVTLPRTSDWRRAARIPTRVIRSTWEAP